MAIYQFIWHEFCDWYIELSKEPLKAGGERRDAARYVLVTVFDRMLRLLHPFMPFISEEIWQVLHPYLSEADGSALSPHLVIAKWPERAPANPLSQAEAAAMGHCIEVTEAINSLRSLLGWHPGQRARAKIKFLDSVESTELESWRFYCDTLAKSEIEPLTSEFDDHKWVALDLGWGKVWVQAPENFDVTKTRNSFAKKLAEVQAHLTRHEARIKDAGFFERASQEAKDETLKRIEDLKSEEKTLKGQLQQLESVG